MLTEKDIRTSKDFKNAARFLHKDMRKVKKMLKNRDLLLDMIKNSPNFHKMKYTYLHRQAIFYLAKELGINIDYMWAHDTEKYIFYLFETEDFTRKMHRTLSAHHWYSLGKNHSETTLVEMMLDWESARFTKPDKPKNAYDTLYCWMPDEIKEPMLPILKRHNLDKHIVFEPLSEDKYKKMSDAVTPNMILDELELAVTVFVEDYIFTSREK